MTVMLSCVIHLAHTIRASPPVSAPAMATGAAAPMPEFLGLKHSVNYTITEVRRSPLTPQLAAPPLTLSMATSPRQADVAFTQRSGGVKVRLCLLWSPEASPALTRPPPPLRRCPPPASLSWRRARALRASAPNYSRATPPPGLRCVEECLSPWSRCSAG